MHLRQCGNILLLLATYNDTHLRHLITHELLADLVEKTLRFVKRVAYASPALWSMYDLVRRTSGKVFLN